MTRFEDHVVYYLQAIRPYIMSYFRQFRRECDVYGFIPLLTIATPGLSIGGDKIAAGTGLDLDLLTEDNMTMFLRQVNLRAILRDLWTERHFGDSSSAGAISDFMPGCRRGRSSSSMEVDTHIPTNNSSNDITPINECIKPKRKQIEEGGAYNADTIHINNPEHKPSAIKKPRFQSREEIQMQAQLGGAKGG